eukprot:scaffold117430_cov35-Tisochrysis_lutea.AAC.1
MEPWCKMLGHRSANRAIMQRTSRRLATEDHESGNHVRWLSDGGASEGLLLIFPLGAFLDDQAVIACVDVVGEDASSHRKARVRDKTLQPLIALCIRGTGNGLQASVERVRAVAAVASDLKTERCARLIVRIGASYRAEGGERQSEEEKDAQLERQAEAEAEWREAEGAETEGAETEGGDDGWW